MSVRLDTEARKLLDRRKENDKAQAAAKKTKQALGEQEERFYAMLEEENLPTATLDLGVGYGRVQFGRRSTIYGRVIDKSRAVAAMREEGYEEEMVEVSLRKAPLNEFIRDRLSAGQKLPEGVDYSETKYIQVTRRKK